ncbi:MAG: N-acetylmuramic acid 6-phosphate etherase [Thermoanaerobaculia bacterium]
MPDANRPWGELPTESRHPASQNLDTLEPEEVVRLLVEEDARGIKTVLRHAAELGQAAEWLADALETGDHILLAGAGTSGRLAVLEAAECPPTFGTEPERIEAVIAGGPDAVSAAREGAEDREDDGRAAADGLRRGDLLIGISASSVTPYVRGALAAARARGARTVLLTCTAASPELASLVDLLVALDTGPEILTGSTRLKAGSATKAALNAITTAAMVRAGKVFENLMVDLRPGSAKLRDRAVRITAAAGNVTPEQAADLLRSADGEVKTAIVMARLGVPAETARHRLSVAGGSVRQALANRSTPGA